MLAVEADLAGGRFRCPCCGGVLGPWGRARRRRLRTRDGVRSLRPRRTRCRERACRKTHVLCPDVCLTRRRFSAELIGDALLACGGYRKAAARLGLVAETVRAWRARFRERAPPITAHFLGWTRALDAAFALPVGGGSEFEDALEAIGCCARSASLLLGRRPPWSWASALTAGALISNTLPAWPSPDRAL